MYTHTMRFSKSDTLVEVVGVGEGVLFEPQRVVAASPEAMFQPLPYGPLDPCSRGGSAGSIQWQRVAVRPGRGVRSQSSCPPRHTRSGRVW